MRVKTIFFITAIGLGLASTAQTVSEGLLLTDSDLHGTARYRGVGGAFGALGADLSAVSKNPAGSSLFANHYVSASFLYGQQQNDQDFFGTQTNDDRDKFTVNQAGFALVYESPREAAVNKYSWGVNFENTRNFNSNQTFIGASNTSLSEFFLQNANGFELNDLEVANTETIDGVYQFLGEQVGYDAQQAFLGYQAFIIDPVDPNNGGNTAYTSAMSNTGLNQRYIDRSRGFQSKLTFNGSIQLDKKWNIGLNLSSHSLFYERRLFVSEQGTGNTSSASFTNDLETNGQGFSAQIGAIGMLTDHIRIGATYESPTWYTIEDRLFQSISSSRQDNNATEEVFISPNVENLFEPYRMRTPGSWTFSGAYIFGTKGFISVDYSIRDYANMHYREDSNQFADNNQFIENELSFASTLNIGGEYRWKRLFFRGGFRHLDSPYKNKDIMGDLQGYSLGFGYDFYSWKLDISWDRSEREFTQDLSQGGLLTNGMVQNRLTNVVLTASFNL